MAQHHPVITVDQNGVSFVMLRKDKNLPDAPSTAQECLHCNENFCEIIEERIQHSMIPIVKEKHMLIGFCPSCMQASIFHYEL